jgi:hypothetical protein
MSRGPFWRVVWEVNGRPAADLYTNASALARRMAQAIADIHGARMSLVDLLPTNSPTSRYSPKRNPTLVHHGIAQGASYHLLTQAGAPLADFYFGKALAEKAAHCIADDMGIVLELAKNTWSGEHGHTHLGPRREGPLAGGVTEIGSGLRLPRRNPSPSPLPGQTWRRRGGGSVRITSVGNGTVVVTDLSSGNRDRFDRLDFIATHTLAGSRPNPKRKGRKSNPGMSYTQAVKHLGADHVAHIVARGDRELGNRMAGMWAANNLKSLAAYEAVRIHHFGTGWINANRRRRGGPPMPRRQRRAVASGRFAKARHHASASVRRGVRRLDTQRRASFGVGRNPRGGPRIVYNKLLGGWYVVTGPHQTPLNGRFNSKAEAQAWLSGRRANPKGRKPTIYEALRDRLGREPTNAELKADVARIISEGSAIGRRRANPKGRKLSVPEQHQLRVARQTLNMTDVGARIMGGPTKEEAREIIRRLTGREPVENPGAIYDALGNGIAVGSVLVGTGLQNAGRSYTVRIIRGKRVQLEEHLTGRLFWTFPRHYRVDVNANPKRTQGVEGWDGWVTGDRFRLSLPIRSEGLSLDRLERGTLTLVAGTSAYAVFDSHPTKHPVPVSLKWLEPEHGVSQRTGKPYKRPKTNPRGRKEGVPPTVGNFIAVLSSKVTQQDQRDARRVRGHSPHALAHWLGAVGRVRAAVAGLERSSDPTALQRLLAAAQEEFTPGFPPLRALEKQIADYTQRGILPSLVRGGAGPQSNSRKRRPKRQVQAARVRGKVRSNPRESAVAKARRTFRRLNQIEPGTATRVRGARNAPKVAVQLGELVSFVYRSDKYAGSKDNPHGKQLLYEHKTKRPRPVLATDPSGREVHIVGGRMHPTPDGLVN